MKKIISIAACLALLLSLCACGKTEIKPIPVLDPAQLITVEDVNEVAGYTPVIEPSGTSREGNSATVLYRSDPIGQNDTVEVKITQHTEGIGYEIILNQYEQGRAKRGDAELVDSIGQSAYIAFPTIHVYERGCLIEITAGSGADETQKNILRSLAIRAAARVEEIMPDLSVE